jgi:hypothetical protein
VTARDFCFWLQGFYELGKPIALNQEQTEMVKRHLDLVFKHEIAPASNSAEITKARQFAALEQATAQVAQQRAAQYTAAVQAQSFGGQLAGSGCGIGGTLVC